MAKRIYTSRTPVIEYQRCKRLRFLGNHAGSQHMGLQPIRKSIHLVLGGAVHAGLEVLLRGSQNYIDVHKLAFPECTDAAAAELLFEGVHAGKDGSAIKNIRAVEDAAVAAALADLAEASKGGVELDAIEQGGGNQTGTSQPTSAMSAKSAGDVASGGDSAIMIDFGDFDAASGQFTEATPVHEISLKDRLKASVALEDQVQGAATMRQFDEPVTVKAPTEITTVQRDDWSQPVYVEMGKPLVDTVPDDSNAALLDQVQVDVARAVAADNQATGMDDYLREELAALVEAMVRAYSRRRLRPLLENFSVLEVEREGSWKLGEIGHDWQEDADEMHRCVHCGAAYIETSTVKADGIDPVVCSELWFASRHDALLLERATGYLYLQSYKTTGSWDRRKEQDAAVDMQGLSEAVDVERRFEEAWRLLKEMTPLISDMAVARVEIAAVARKKFAELDRHVDELVNPATKDWLLKHCLEAPKILGVRYEYLLKGARRQDKKDLTAAGFPRYVADTPLVRAWKQDGIAAGDRRWQPSYEWFELSGKSRRVDYRSWQKAAVWKYMPVADWIGMLDSGEAWPDQYDADGQAVDWLAEQFIPVVTVYRAEDDMRDWLEQLEAQEQQVAIDVAAVQAVENDPAAYRSELNRRFAQTRASCAFPGRCAHFDTCHGPYEIRRNPEDSGLFRVRQPNHPIEGAAQS